MEVKSPLWKNWWFWLLIVLIVVYIGSNSSGGNQDANTTTPPNQTTTPKPEVADQKGDASLLAEIKVEPDIQDIIDGKHKIVVNITNNTDKLFNGYVGITVTNSSGSEIGKDTVIVDKLVPKGKTYSIIWSKPGAAKVDYKVSGSFSEFKASVKSSFPYEIVLTKPGNSYQTFCVVVESIDKNGLIEVIKELKSQYTKDKVLGFQIFFYTKDMEASAKAGKFADAKANYGVNYKTGYSTLSLDSGSVEVK